MRIYIKIHIFSFNIIINKIYIIKKEIIRIIIILIILKINILIIEIEIKNY